MECFRSLFPRAVLALLLLPSSITTDHLDSYKKKKKINEILSHQLPNKTTNTSRNIHHLPRRSSPQQLLQPGMQPPASPRDPRTVGNKQLQHGLHVQRGPTRPHTHDGHAPGRVLHQHSVIDGRRPKTIPHRQGPRLGQVPPDRAVRRSTRLHTQGTKLTTKATNWSTIRSCSTTILSAPNHPTGHLPLPDPVSPASRTGTPSTTLPHHQRLGQHHNALGQLTH